MDKHRSPTHPFAVGPEHPLRGLVVALGTLGLAMATGLFYLGARPGPALLTEPGPHGAGQAACLDCHVPFSGTPSTRCLGPGCHSALATGTPPRDGPALPVRYHVAVRKLSCQRCHEAHRTEARVVTPHGTLDRPLLEQLCVRCHSGRHLESHAKTDEIGCWTCHALDSWALPTPKHGTVAQVPCEVCHTAPRTDHPAPDSCERCHALDGLWTQLEK